MTEEFHDGMRTMRDEMIMQVLEDNDCLLAEGFEKALVGHTHGANIVAVYDYERCIEILMTRDEMSCIDAIEFLEFNTIGSYVGDKTPIFVSSR